MSNEMIAAKAAMLIRKPVATVFEAFVNPEQTTQFWFTKSSGRMEAGAELTWEWEMYQYSTTIKVLQVQLNQRILMEWGNRGETTTVEWIFTSLETGTFVEVCNTGFTGDETAIRKWLTDTTEGFTLVLAGAKAFLEHGLRLELTGDRFPKGL